jgi:hypothetical protein
MVRATIHARFVRNPSTWRTPVLPLPRLSIISMCRVGALCHRDRRNHLRCGTSWDTAHGNDMMKSRTTLRKMVLPFDRLAQVLSVRAASTDVRSARLQVLSPHVSNSYLAGYAHNPSESSVWTASSQRLFDLPGHPPSAVRRPSGSDLAT